MGSTSSYVSSSSSSKWLGFVAAVWIQCISGNNYTFSNYSDALKSLMHLTQLQLNNLSVAKDVGKAFGLLAGLASDRFPTWAILLIGSVEGLIGYGTQWLVVSQRIQPLPYSAPPLLAGNSTTWMNTAVLVTCIRNFRSNRGPVSGILKGFVGLSTAIFTTLCSALFADDPGSFLIMLSVIPFAVCLTGVFFLREILPVASADADAEEVKYFGVFNVVAVAMALVLAYGFIPSPSMLVSRLFVAVLVVMLASPLGIPVYSYLKGRLGGGNDVERQRLKEPLLQIPEKENEGVVAEEEAEIVKRAPEVGEEHTIVEALRSVDFWILFVSFLCGVGTGLAVMNNMGQIGLALGYPDVSLFLSLTSIFGFFGRIISGTVSEFTIKKAATPRPLWNAASQLLMAVGYILLAMAMPGSLYIGSILVGMCYGVRLAITVPTASELFGLKYYGLIYNILILNLPLGSFLFSGLLAGILYDMEATTTEGGGNTCVGGHCYRLVFIVMTGACIVGFFLDILLSIRTKNIYTKISTSKKPKKSLGTSNRQ
ncbi:Putative membrane protein YMR155W [Glycine soja]|nr:Putative membrane protein YMR155W [Glycine soja]